MEDGLSMEETKQLELDACIGFAGEVHGGLILHPDDKKLIYPLGSTIVIKSVLKSKQRFLSGGHDVSCLALNRDGTMLAAGQVTHMGFPAEVIVWKVEDGEVLHRLKLHKGKIQSLDFSPSGKYLATLGGEDDNKVVIWNLSTGDAICGSTAANDSALLIKYYNKSDDLLVTAGKYNLRSWSFDLTNRKIRPTDCKLGQLKRVVQCLVIDREDNYMYCGTLSGDVLKIALQAKLFHASGPVKRKFSRGVQSIIFDFNGNLLIGGGDGVVALVNSETLKVLRTLKLEGMITSLSLNKAGDHFFVGTSLSCSYLVALDTFEFELRSSSHFGRINDVAYPSGYSELFVTASVNDIRVWHARNQNELLRIQVPNLECLCVALNKDGACILSGWSDGKIRAFLPESGRLMFTINDAHNASEGGVTAIVSSSNGSSLVSGGADGLVRVWTIKPDSQIMRGSLKEHKAKVKSICINSDDTMFVSAGQDGSCVLWDMKKLLRLNALFASTQFSTVVLHPDESQLLTTGSDRKITYWDAVDGTAIRILDGSETAAVNTLNLTSDGEHFVSGGADKVVRVWHYDQGYCLRVGLAHSGVITKCLVSPDQQNIVSVGDEGAIMIWKMDVGKSSGVADNVEKPEE